MHCPRLYHFRRINSGGTFGTCGHMIDAPEFKSIDELESSEWLSNCKSMLVREEWPAECLRCQEEEASGKNSVRLSTLTRHDLLKSLDSNYLIVGGVLDNICNAACQTCDENLSTKIGSLMRGKNYVLNDNMQTFLSLPQDRILELDISGGEPSNSPNYLRILSNPPANLKILRMNTNASKYVDQIERLLDSNIKVTITISIDGVDDIFEYVRWPLKWNTFKQVVDRYIELRNRRSNLDLNFWTTVSAYNIKNLDMINQYANTANINATFSLLKEPKVLDIRYSNFLTDGAKGVLSGRYDNIIATDVDNTKAIMNYIKQQDFIRGTNYENCYNRS